MIRHSLHRAVPVGVSPPTINFPIWTRQLLASSLCLNRTVNALFNGHNHHSYRPFLYTRLIVSITALLVLSPRSLTGNESLSTQTRGDFSPLPSLRICICISLSEQHKQPSRRVSHSTSLRNTTEEREREKLRENTPGIVKYCHNEPLLFCLRAETTAILNCPEKERRSLSLSLSN